MLTANGNAFALWRWLRFVANGICGWMFFERWM